MIGAWPLWKSVPHRLAACLALVLLAGAGWRGATLRADSPAVLGQGLRFRGSVVADPVQGHAGPRLLVDVEAVAPATGGLWEGTRGRVMLQVVGTPSRAPSRGDAVVFRARLRPPKDFQNPGSRGYADYLARQGVGARASAPWPGAVAFARPGPAAPGWLRWRRNASAAIARAVPGRAGAVVRAITLGDRSGLTPKTRESFRRAGTSHLVAISGLHLGILALLLIPGLRWLLVRIPGLALSRPAAPLAWALTLPALSGYAALSGFQTSTLRALAMAGLLVASLTRSRPTAPLTLLGATSILLALPRPAVLGEVGFQLSLAALAGLFWLAPRLERRLTRPVDPLEALFEPNPLARVGRWLARGFRTVACAGVAATLTTAPVLLLHFGSASLAGLVLNPLAVPLVGFLCLPVALVGTLLYPVWPDGGALLWSLASIGIEGLIVVQDAVAAHVPDLSAQAARSPSGLVGALFLLVWFGLALDGRIRTRSASALLCAGTLALGAPPAVRLAWAHLDSRVHLWALDVGQGQAVALKVAGDRWVLVDAGGFPGSSFDMGQQVVVPALERLGASTLWLAVSTHPHPDHLGGMVSAVRWGRPEALWLPGSFEGDPRYAPLLDEARRSETRVVWVGRDGSEIDADAAHIEAVWVPGSRENDRCLVLRVSAGDSAALLPADLEVDGQRRLLDSGFPVRCDVLVAPHHGSRTALYPPFLQAARPAAVLVSAAGWPGLPSSAFVAAAEALGASVRSTHREGCLRARYGRGQVLSVSAVY